MITETLIVTVGGQRDFTFTFPYITKSHLSVKVNDVATSDWSLTSTQVLRLGDTFSGGGALSINDTVAISRTTPIADPLVTFSSPSTLRSSEINLAIQQVLYNLQEQDAQTLSTLNSDAGFTRWEGQNLPLKSLGAPVDATDAARKTDIDNAIVAGGNIPAFSIADAGRALSINSSGNVGWQSPGGGISTFKVSADPSPVTYADGGHQLVDGNTTETADWTVVGADLPVEKVADVAAWWSGTAPSVSGDSVIVLPTSGVYEVTVRGKVRSLPNATPGISSAAAAITNDLGLTVFDRQTNMRLGQSGTGDTWQGTESFVLTAYITVSGSQNINLRALKGNPADVVMDTPTIITVKEIR